MPDLRDAQGYSPGSPFYSGPAGGGISSLPYAGVRNFSQAFGGIPSVPNPIGTAGMSIGGNIGNLGALYNLATGTSGASAAGAQQQYLANLPDYANLTAARSANIGNNFRGIVGQDVTNQLGQVAAQRGVSFGAGAPNTNAALLAALGQTSMGLQRQAQQEYNAAFQATPRGPEFNPIQFQAGPQDVQSAAYQANILGAAPVPSAAAAAAEAAARRGLNTGYGMAGGGYPSSYANQSNFGGGPSTWAGLGGGGGGAYAGSSPLGQYRSPIGPSQGMFPVGGEPTRMTTPHGYNPFTDQSTMNPYGSFGQFGNQGGGLSQYGYEQWNPYGDMGNEEADWIESQGFNPEDFGVNG